MPKGKRKRGGPIMLDIKLRHIRRKGEGPPTRDQVIECLEHMLATGGDVPEHWVYAAIDWSRPGKASEGFRSGSIANFAQFAPLIRKRLAHFKVSVDRSPPPSDG